MLAAVTEEEGRPAGKGRPTPKRKDARKQRRTAVPSNPKEAAKLRRDKARDQRALQRQALLSGDERHLPPRDAGPAKRLARDVVDSRFTLGQIFFGMILIVLALSLTIHGKSQAERSAAAAVNLVSIGALVIVFVDSLLVGRKAKREVVAKFGVRESLGITGYAMVRAMQPRRMRRPPPKKKRGDPL
jgi:hypothetical protein